MKTKTVRLPMFIFCSLCFISCENKQTYLSKEKISISENQDFAHHKRENTVSIDTSSLFVEKHQPLPKKSAQQDREKGVVQEKKITATLQDLTTDYQAFTFSEISKKLATPMQTFEVSALKDTVLVCKEGTKLHIKANIFVLPNRTLPKGNIEVKIQEYYDLASMVIGNLSTKSNGELLESGGMFYIEATANGQPLTLRKGKTLEIEAPVYEDFKKEGMQVFYSTSQEKGTNWTLGNTQNTISIRQARPNSTIKKFIDFYSFYEETYARQGKNKPILLEKEDLKTLPDSILKQTQYFDTVTISYLVNKQGNIKRAKVLAGTGVLKNVKAIAGGKSFSLTRMETVYESQLKSSNFNQYRITLRNAKGDIDTEIDIKRKDFKKLLKEHDWNKKKYVEILVKKAFFRKITYQKIMYRNTNVPFGVNIPSMEEVQNKYKNKTATNTELAYYALQANRLGWINIDRFYKDDAPKVNFMVKADKNTDVRIVFPKLKSLMNWDTIKEGDNYKIFKAAPKGQTVVLVAIRMLENKPQLALLKTVISKNGLEEPLVFNTMNSLEELKNEVGKMLKQ